MTSVNNEEENRTARWLGRSLAELIVIIAGVMIALAADRWIAGIDERAEARSYMSRLVEDIREDSANLAWSAQLAAEREQTTLDMLLYAETGELPGGMEPEAFLRQVRLAAAFVSGRRGTARTWDALVSMGKVDLIGDEALRDSLSLYYSEESRIAGLFGQSGLDMGVAAHVADPLWDVIPPLQMLSFVPAMLPEEVRADYELSAEEAEQLLRALSMRKDFLAGIGRMRMVWSVTSNNVTNQLRSAGLLLERLEAEGG